LRLYIEQPNLVTFDLKTQNDVATGMYFDSSIPQGYSGSSGALVAAIYENTHKIKLPF
jgi:mevalonate kinase